MFVEFIDKFSILLPKVSNDLGNSAFFLKDGVVQVFNIFLESNDSILLGHHVPRRSIAFLGHFGQLAEANLEVGAHRIELFRQLASLLLKFANFRLVFDELLLGRGQFFRLGCRFLCRLFDANFGFAFGFHKAADFARSINQLILEALNFGLKCGQSHLLLPVQFLPLFQQGTKSFLKFLKTCIHSKNPGRYIIRTSDARGYHADDDVKKVD